MKRKIKVFFKSLWSEIKDIRTLIIFIIVFIVMCIPTWLGFLLYWLFGYDWALAMGSASLLFWNVVPCTPFFPLCVGLTLGIKKILNKLSRRNNMNELSTKISKLDLQVILANYYKPEFWKNSWTIFKNDEFELKLRIETIEVQDNKINLSVSTDEIASIEGKNIELYYFEKIKYFSIPIKHDEFTEDMFKDKVLNASLGMVNVIETNLVRYNAEYKNIIKLYDEELRQITKVAEEKLDSLDIQDSSLRDSYIYKCQQEIAKYPTILNDFIESKKYHIIPNQYLMVTAFLGNDEDYNNMTKNCNTISKKEALDIKEKMDELHSAEYIENMKGVMENI